MSQRLYQLFKTRLSSDFDQRQIDDWWSWIQDFGNLKEEAEDHVLDYVEQLKSHRPIQYIFQRAFFFDLELFVDERVLIPRPETEELVDEVRKNSSGLLKFLDVGTGSGAIALMLKTFFPQSDVAACDLSEEALTVARKNASDLGMDIFFFEADLFDADSFLKKGPWDVIVSNPPYISQEEKSHMSSNTRFEPDEALFAPDNRVIEVYDSLRHLGETHLNRSGQLLLELNEYMVNDITDLFQPEKWEVRLIKDMQGKERILHATLKL